MGMLGTLLDKKRYRVRILHNLAATTLGQGINFFGQLVTVPIFLYFWGNVLYGEWILLSTIPAYFAMNDVGFAGAGMTEMTVLVARNERAAALEVFQSIWILISASSLLFLTVLAIVLMWAPLNAWLNIAHLSDRESVFITLLLLCHAAVSQQTGLIQAGFRCEGATALGVNWNNLVRMGELLLTAAMVASGSAPLMLAAASLLVRLLGTVLMRAHLYRIAPWLAFGWRHVKFRQIRRLAGPAFAFLAFPLGYALKNQGIVLVIGRLLGPVAVVAFATTRTLTNSVFQLMGIINHSVWPEMSAAFGAGDLPLARGMHRHSCRASLWVSSAAVTGLFFFGAWIYRFWTGGKVTLDLPLFHVLLVVLIANSLWYTSFVVPLAINRHQRTALCFLLGTVVTVLLTILLLPRSGLVGAGIALLVIDAVMLCQVLPSSLELLQDRFVDFILVVLRPPLAWRGSINR